MKKRYIRSAVLCLAAIIFTFQFGGAAMAAEVGYTDVSPESPWYDGIEYVIEQGISNGTGTNSFSPDAPITVRQWSVMLCRAYNEAEALEKDKAEFGTYCSTQAYWNGWIQMEAVTAPDTQMSRGTLYQSAFAVIRLPVYNFELYPDGYFLCGEENCVRIAAELGICDTGTSAYDIVTRAEAADLIYRIMTQEFIIAAPPMIDDYPIENNFDVNLSPYLEELTRVPEPIIQAFKDSGWKYAVDFDYISEFSQELGTSVIGVCDYGARHIYVTEASATLHEFGHFLDKNQGWVSRNTTYYADESQAAGAFMRDYALTSAQEYYADYFVHWLRFQGNPEKLAMMKELTPQTFDYFSNLASNNWGQ